MTRTARSTMPLGIAVLLLQAAASAGADATSFVVRPALSAGSATSVRVSDGPRATDNGQRLLLVKDGQTVNGSRLAKGKFLVASRELVDPNFFEAVILLVDYDMQGALGVVVNRPTAVRLGEALPEVKELRRRKDVVFLGGPVARDRMLLLVRTASEPPQSFRVFDRVWASGNLDALRASLSRGEGVRAFAGYAGWGPGQLDAEVARGDWLIGPADAKALFDTAPAGIWDDLVERFSGDWTMLSPPRFAAY